MDCYYTSPELAQELIWAVGKDRTVARVADFAAGRGELLRAAQGRWPRAAIFALDLDGRAVARLRRENPKWRVARCDFLDPISRERTSILAGLEGQVSLVVLNPPFSYRGGRRYPGSIDGTPVTCGPAMAFLLASLPYLRRDGDLLAVLPAGLLKTEKDEEARRLLRHRYDLEVVATNGRSAFQGCYPGTVLVHVRPLREGRALGQMVGSPKTACRWRRGHIVVRRGTVQMHSLCEDLPKKSLPLVHSTELSDGKANTGRRGGPDGRSVVRGPAVLLPRVGRPSKDKISLYLSRSPVVISDCVFALLCEDSEHARAVQKAFTNRWPTVEQEYGGTCAPYLTVRSLVGLCGHFGFRAKSVYRA